MIPTFSEDSFKRLHAALALKKIRLSCYSCPNENMGMLDSFAMIPTGLASKDGTFGPFSQHAPHVVLVCPKCGFTAMHRLQTLGITMAEITS